MQINIYKDKMLGARLFGASVLYSVQPIPRDDVPQGWFCYDLRGTARHPDEPHALVDKAEENRTGTILSYLPLKNGRSQYRLVKDMFQMAGTNPTLAEFCAVENIRCPETPLRHLLRPASPEEAGLFYAQTLERDEELGAIGHVRIDFGRGGKDFYHSWQPRGPEELNTQEFKDELTKVVNDLRKGVLKDLPSMRRYCGGGEGAIEGGTCCQNYGFTLETERYLYRLRCNPAEGDYQVYLSCFDKQAQRMGLTEKGRQTLRDAANPAFPHSYHWYVIEHINTPEQRVSHELPLEEAIQLYASLDCEDKRLGVTKDDIAAVDLMICQEGREWLSQDRLKMDCFKDDPVVAEAADKLQQLLDGSMNHKEQPAKKNYTLDEFLKAIEPQYQEYKNTMRQCIAGLTEHAARLAAQGQEESLPRLRRLCIEMAEFWVLTQDDTPKGFQEMADHFGSTFDSAVSAARDSGQAPDLSAQTRQNILDGLELYAQEMRLNDEELEDWAVECEILAEDLEEQWQLEDAATQRTAPQMDGMNL